MYLQTKESGELGLDGDKCLIVTGESWEESRASEMVVILWSLHVSTSEPWGGTCLMTTRAEDSLASMVQLELPSLDVCSSYPSKLRYKKAEAAKRKQEERPSPLT